MPARTAMSLAAAVIFAGTTLPGAVGACAAAAVPHVAVSGAGRAKGQEDKIPSVIDNRAEQEFELTIDGITAIAAYQLEGDTIVFTHTYVPDALAGHGVGSRLIRGALDQARDRGLRVVPQCPFVADYIQRHPEYRDLVR